MDRVSAGGTNVVAIAIGEFVLDDLRFELRRGEDRVRVQPKVLHLLLHLAAASERAVSHDELLEVLWPDERVTPASVKRAIRGARQALGDDGDSQSSIRTVRGRGYQLVLPVRPLNGSSTSNGARHEAEPAAAGPEPSQDAFVGRRGVVAVLESSMRDAFAGHGRMLVLVGEPGIGKTRTLLELSRRAAALGAQAWFGRCIEDEGAPAFWPWTQILRDGERDRGASALLALMGKSAADIAEGLPELRAWLPDLPSAPTITQLSARFRFFDGVTTFLKRAADAHPLVLLFDDLQRADQPTLSLLSFVARHLDRSRLLVAASCRPLAAQDPSVREALTRFIHDASAPCIELDGLGHDDVDRYIELRTGQRGPRRIVERVHRLTAGNPLFMQQILHSWQVHGALQPAVDWDALSAGTRAQGLRSSIAHLLGGFDLRLREALSVAAVLGTEFTLLRLARMLDADPASLLSLLAIATGARILREDDSEGGAYRFSHVLIRDALYEDLAVDTRAMLHARAGLALEAAGPPSSATLAELAHHFTEAWPAHDGGKALQYNLRAAAADQERLAYEEAVTHLDRALRILTSGPADPRERMRVLLDKGKALSHVAEVEQARAALLEAAELARALGDHAVLAEAASLVAGSPEGGNVDLEQLEVLREALALLPADSPRRPLLLALLAKTLTFSSDSEARVALARDAIELSKHVADPPLRAEVLHQCQRALPEVHHFGEREAITSELLCIGHQLGDYRVLGNAAIAQIQSCLERGNIAGTDRALADLEHVAAHAREPIFRWYSQVFRGMRLFVAGDIGEAIQASLEARRMGACVGDEMASQTCASQIAGWYRVVGRLAEAEAMARENMLRFPRVAGWRLAVAHAQADRGSYEFALATLAEVMQNPSSLDPFTHSLLAPLAEMCGFFGTAEMAKTLYDLLLPFAARWGNIAFGVSTTGPIGRALAMLAIRGGQLDAAEHHIENALASSVAAKSPTYEALALMTYARALIKRGDPESRERAAGMLAASEVINERCGFTGNSNMIRFMCRRAKLVLPATTAPSSA